MGEKDIELTGEFAADRASNDEVGLRRADVRKAGSSSTKRTRSRSSAKGQANTHNRKCRLDRIRGRGVLRTH